MKKTSIVLAGIAGVLWLTLLAGWIKNQIMNNSWGFAFITQRTREYKLDSQISKKPVCGNKKLEATEQCELGVYCRDRTEKCNLKGCICESMLVDPCWGGICPPSYGNSHGWNPNNGNPSGYGNSNKFASELTINYATWSTWFEYRCMFNNIRLFPGNEIKFWIRTYPYDIPQQWISLSCSVYNPSTNWSISWLPIQQWDWNKSSFFNTPAPWEYVITCSIYETFLADASALARCRTSVTVE